MLNGGFGDPKWRVFRLFLESVSERDLPDVLHQLDREVAARQECDANAMRLFFSTLTTNELETARQEILLNDITPIEIHPKPVCRVRRSRARKPPDSGAEG
jgi:hypothetical protein